MHVRKAGLTDGPQIFRVHVHAVRALCASHYSKEQIDAWVGGKHAASYDAAIASRETFVAIDCDEVIGFSQLHVATCEIEAVYVDPRSVRRHVGSALLARLEEAAKQNSLDELHLDASTNAVSFYSSHGYRTEREGLHRLNSGVEIPCIRMSKRLTE